MSQVIIALLLLGGTPGENSTTVDTPVRRLAQFDNLLLSGDLEGASGWLLRNRDIADSGSADRRLIDSLSTKLDKINAYVAGYRNQPEESRRNLVRARLEQATVFDSLRAGAKAHQLFVLAGQAAEDRDWIEAIKLLQIARFFQLRFLPERSLEVRQSYDRAHQLLNDGEPQAASQVLDSLGYIPDNPVYFGDMVDQIRQLRHRVDAASRVEHQREIQWGSQKVVRTRAIFYVGGMGLRQPAANALTIADYPVSDIQNSRSSIQPRLRPGFYGGIRYAVKPRLLVGLSVMTYSSRYSAILYEKVISFDLTARHLAVEGDVQYLLRDKVGLRPFVGCGIGVMHYKQDASEYSIFRPGADEDNAMEIFTYPIPSRSGSSGVSSFEFGAQFIPSQSSWWAVSAGVDGYIYLDSNDTFEFPNLSLTLRVEAVL